MKRALVIGASGGIGAALVDVLRVRGDDVTGVSRREDGLDVTDPESVSRVMGGLRAPYHTILISIGILAPPEGSPEKQLAAIDAASMARVFAVNTIGVALILRHLPDLLPTDDPCHVGVLTARVGSIGDNKLGGWYSYRASKAATNMLIRSTAIEVARKRKHAVVAALHPGTVATSFTAGYSGHSKISPQTSAEKLLSVLSDLQPSQTGNFYDHMGEEVEW